MDYGKLAYLKAEELETRLNTVNQTPKQRLSCQTIAIGVGVVSGQELYLTQLSADGSAGLVVKINCSEIFGSGSIELYVGDLSVGSAVFSANASDCEGVIIGSVLIDSFKSMTLKAVGGFSGTVKSVDVLATGDNVSVDMRLSGYAFDGKADKLSYAVPVENCVCASVADSGNGLLFSDRTELGRGSKCDIVWFDGFDGSQGCFKVVFADNCDNVWGVSLDGEMPLRRVYLGWYEGIKRVRLAVYRNRLIFAYLIGGRIYYSALSNDFGGLSQGTVIPTHVRADDFGFVKGEGSLTMFYCAENKGFVKTLEDESVGSENIGLKLSVEIESF